MISELCVYDIARDYVSVLLSHTGHIEAPNWHPEGYLIVNGSGRLFRVPIEKPELVALDTDFAVKCNNDHGISPDGTRLVISDRSRTESSCIYTMPIGGGVPERVTPNTPSYWHGWSPDGKMLAYVGRRSGPFALYICQVDGSGETCVTEAFDHVDGPDYTPDGQWIWFNGERAGAVDLWRVRPDGSGLQQMTNDKAVNWFPHPSPDGTKVLYLAYPSGTQGHPAEMEVGLCLMPSDGGDATEVVRLHGGQGTINVPCWSPDSRQFAFMRYAV